MRTRTSPTSSVRQVAPPVSPEWSVAGTCDWDNTYHGWLVDDVNDGSCVYSEFLDAGIWNVQAYACNTGVWTDYWWGDRDGDHFTFILLCRDYGCIPNWIVNYGY